MDKDRMHNCSPKYNAKCTRNRLKITILLLKD